MGTTPPAANCECDESAALVARDPRQDRARVIDLRVEDLGNS